MRNLSGIVGYGVATRRDESGGVGLTVPPAYQLVAATEEQFVITVPTYELNDGDVMVIWFTVSDTSGNRDDVRMVVGLDRTRPDITSEQFNRETVDEFTST